MAKIAFILYVGCVLMFSAFARAESLKMPFTNMNMTALTGKQPKIEAVGFNEATLELAINGYVPTLCDTVPTATLTEDIESPNTLILRLSLPSHKELCNYKTKEFDTVVSLPVIAQNSIVKIEERALYQIKIEGYPMVMNVHGSELLRVPGFISY